MTLKEQLYYVREAASEMAEQALGLDGKAKTLLMQDEETRYQSTDLESSIRRLFGEIDELTKSIEVETRWQAEGDKLASNTANLDKI